ncbi:MAG: IS1634 family transposase [Syntrophales bacterium]|nr:IS1634 family transposase [Syntrophales bacterium]
MAIHKVKRNGHIYLSEYKSVRVNGKVKSIYVRYLGPEDEVKAGKKSKKRVLDRVQISRSTRAGDVGLLWEIARDLDFVGIIDRICCQEFGIQGPSPGKFLTIWAINRALEPESCTQLERWVKTTDLPELANIEPELFKKDAFLSSLDFVCSYDSLTNSLIDYTASIDDALYQHQRHICPLPSGEKETVAYDLTSILFFGVTCPIAELGRNPKKMKQRQVNLALLVSKYDRHPIAHFVYNGKRKDASTVKNLLARLDEIAIEPGTLIWDRGNVSNDHVKMVESTNWKLICGVPITSKDALSIIDDTDIELTPSTYILKSRTGHIYASKSDGPLYGKKRSLIVYVNPDRHMKEMNIMNEALADIGNELDILAQEGKNRSEVQLHKSIDEIVGSWKDCIHVRVKRKGTGSCIGWKYRNREIERIKRRSAKYIILSTDETLSSKDVISSYFEKDYIEKVFRIFKTEEEIEPVRHRLENRVRSYMFVCVLAYRLLSALRFKFVETGETDSPWEQTYGILQELSRVERTEIGFGNEIKTLYLNDTKSIKDKLKKIGMKDMLKEEIRLKP